MKKQILFLLLGISLTACGPKIPEPRSHSSSAVPAFALSQVPNSEIEAQLLLTARSIESSLSALAIAANKEVAPALNTSLLVTPEGGMGARASIDWSGPVQALVDKIADLSQYELKILGNEPAVPLVVSITGQDVIVADILKDAGLQLGLRGDIVVYPNSKVIELRYASM